MDPDPDPGGPKHVNLVDPDSDPDPQHCYITYIHVYCTVCKGEGGMGFWSSDR
jgi:hypothetical protein